MVLATSARGEVEAEAEPLHHPRPELLDQDVGAGEIGVETPAVIRRFEVETIDSPCRD